MPRLSVVFIRTSLLYLAAGFTLGALMLINKGIALDPYIWRLLPIHIEFVLVGWTVQLALGVAFWVLPRFSRGAARGDERPAWVAYILLNLSLIGLALSPWTVWANGLILAGRIGELLAVASFAIHAWRRIKAPGM